MTGDTRHAIARRIAMRAAGLWQIDWVTRRPDGDDTGAADLVLDIGLVGPLAPADRASLPGPDTPADWIEAASPPSRRTAIVEQTGAWRDAFTGHSVICHAVDRNRHRLTLAAILDGDPPPPRPPEGGTTPAARMASATHLYDRDGWYHRTLYEAAKTGPDDVIASRITRTLGHRLNAPGIGLIDHLCRLSRKGQRDTAVLVAGSISHAALDALLARARVWHPGDTARALAILDDRDPELARAMRPLIETLAPSHCIVADPESLISAGQEIGRLIDLLPSTPMS